MGLTGELGHLKKPHIVCHGPHENRRVRLLVPHVPHQARKGERRAVGLGHIQPLQDNLRKGAVSSPGEEPEQLHEQAEVNVVRHRGRAHLVAYTAAASHEINTHLASLGSTAVGVRTEAVPPPPTTKIDIHAVEF